MTTKTQTITLDTLRAMSDDEQAETLRAIYRHAVQHPEGHWKGKAVAMVATDSADLVEHAMNFMGSIVDQRLPLAGGKRVALISEGYWAHGF